MPFTDHVCKCEKSVAKKAKQQKLSVPARIAFPGCVSLAFPAGAAAARHCGLWNGFTNPGWEDMTAESLLFFPLLFKVNAGVMDRGGSSSQSVSQPSGPHVVQAPCAGVVPPTLTIGLLIVFVYFAGLLPPRRTRAVKENVESV